MSGGGVSVRDELNSMYAKDLESVPEARYVLQNDLPQYTVDRTYTHYT